MYRLKTLRKWQAASEIKVNSMIRKIKYSTHFIKITLTTFLFANTKQYHVIGNNFQQLHFKAHLAYLYTQH